MLSSHYSRAEEGVPDAACSLVGSAVRAGCGHSSVCLSELGGVDDALKAFCDLVILPITSPDIIRRFGVKPPRGVLLSGPPGSGKTVLTRAIAHEANANLLVCILHACFMPVDLTSCICWVFTLEYDSWYALSP
jgi:hypothetical protein